MTHTAYEKLKDRFRTIANLGGAGSILYMDSMTAMKPGSDNDRSEQMMALASAGHMLLTDPVVKDWLDESESNTASLSPADQKNLYLMRRQWIAATALPESLSARSAVRVSMLLTHVESVDPTGSTVNDHVRQSFGDGVVTAAHGQRIPGVRFDHRPEFHRG